MDPLAALGVAAAVVQFVSFAAQLIEGAHAIHHSIAGQTAENEQLDFVITEMKNLSGRLASSKPLCDQSNDEKAVGRLTAQCATLSNAILDILERVRAKNPKSKWSSAKAALKGAWGASEKEELQQQLDSCRSQLNLQLTALMGSETKERLDRLIKTGEVNSDDITSLRRHVTLLKQGVEVKHISDEAMNQLRKLLMLSDQALLAVAQHRILGGLRFQLMNERFHDVAEAHNKTFEWIFDADHQITSEELPQGKLQMSFPRWLEHGNGVFHIAGKPGSGKSTLMKFLCRQERTKELLQAWAKPKSLVFSQFFFWKLGEPMQKTLKGLMRALLYSVVSQCPEITQTIFPKQYSETQSFSWSASIPVYFDHDEILSAFERLLNIPDVSRRFCFFIDGLDEFEGDHEEFVNKLNSWTTSTNDVKICVSSREWNIFRQSFSPKQRLRLQDLTREDIEKIVNDALQDHKHFLAIQKDPYKRKNFLQSIIYKAEGVFLWVTLVVALIKRALLSKCRFSELERKVETAQPELKPLFRQLFDEIHPSDLMQSYRTFAVVKEMGDRKVKMGDRKSVLSLFRYSFFDDYDEDAEFAMKLPIRNPPMNMQEVLDCLDGAKMRLSAQCGGLIEVRPYGDSFSGAPLGNSFSGPPLGNNLDHRLVLAHRDITEFLHEADIKQRIDDQLRGVDILDVVLQSFLAQVKSVYLPSRKGFDLGPPFDHPLSHELLEVLSSISNAQREIPQYFKFLDSVDAAIFRTNRGVAFRLLNHLQPRNPESKDDMPKNVVWRLPYMAASHGLYDYVSEKVSPHDSPAGSDLNLEFIFCNLLKSHKNHKSQDCTRCIKRLLRKGVDPNCRSLPNMATKYSWENFLTDLVMFILERGNENTGLELLHLCQTIEACLQYGADTTFWMKFKPGSTHVYVYSRFFGHPFSNGSNEKFVKYATERGGCVTLRDLIIFIQPENLRSILNLIDRNPHQHGASSTSETTSENSTEADIAEDSSLTEANGPQLNKELDGIGGSLVWQTVFLDHTSIRNIVINVLGKTVSRL